MIPDLGAVNGAPGISDGAILGAIVGLVALLITTLAGLWKSSHDSRAQMRLTQMQHEQNRADRASEAEQSRLDRDAKANELKAQLALTALQQQQTQDVNALRLQDRVEFTARDVAHKVDQAVSAAKVVAAAEIGAQTSILKSAIEGSQGAVVDKAESAYREANSVNVKIAALHATNAAIAETLAAQATVLAELMRTVERRGAPRPAGETFERRGREGTAADRRPTEDQKVVAVVEAKE